ncbi:Calcipressin-domain-containing protein [Parachaetomium inaequale]|uniref:Calcipressin-domain-containing protein n=1 Tax=Parachaetomium inaequale TaxID=2588326 RepID=A0AAN6SQA8_9PEZI|nr:Calcipressin-domain-containing protein [Parachaetomium inaequale]
MEQHLQRELPLRTAQQGQEPQQLSPELRPAPSRSSSGSSTRSRKSTLTLDLTNLPPLVKPTPPCNTLIFTNLQSRDIFAPDNLQQIRDLISQKARIHAFSPLKSLSRIIVSFYTDEDAIAVRQIWDGEAIMGERCRVYFGQPTPLTTQPHNLALPDAGKLFFISPPPSPPHGWEQKMEDAPNKMVHAEDLAEALARLRHHNNPNNADVGVAMASPVSPAESSRGPQRSRSSTLVFQPNPELGVSPDLPCVIIHDMTDEPEELSPIAPAAAAAPKPIMAHTARPPVELMMHDA